MSPSRAASSAAFSTVEGGNDPERAACSTAATRETVKWEDGNEYPLVKLEISNTSHPFFTGQKMLVDTAGRIDKFKKRYEKK